MTLTTLIGLNLAMIAGIIYHDYWKEKKRKKKLEKLRNKIPSISRNVIQYAEYAYTLLVEGKEQEAQDWIDLAQEEINKGDKITREINQLIKH